jgi:hypothetical protein
VPSQTGSGPTNPNWLKIRIGSKVDLAKYEGVRKTFLADGFLVTKNIWRPLGLLSEDSLAKFKFSIGFSESREQCDKIGCILACLGDCLLWKVLLKNYRSCTNVWAAVFFHSKIYIIIWTKRLGRILGDLISKLIWSPWPRCSSLLSLCRWSLIPKNVKSNLFHFCHFPRVKCDLMSSWINDHNDQRTHF